MKTPEQREAERQARGEKWKEPPLFTQAAPGGKCPGCGGTSFRRPLISRWSDGLPQAFFYARRYVECVTCGKRFTRG